MKTFNVSQFYNGFYCYFKSICSNFDKLFTLFCLHPIKPWLNIVIKYRLNIMAKSNS